MRILLVEDSEHDRIALRRAFERSRANDELVEAGSAREALALFDRKPSGFDLLISDYKMEGMNGFELCKEAMRINARLPTVLVTGYGDEELAASSIKSGIGDYIVKDVARSYISKLSNAVDRLAAGNTSKGYAMADRLNTAEAMLSLLTKESSDAILLEALRHIKNFGNFDSVALRMRKADDYPFIAQIGLPQEHHFNEMGICSKSAQSSLGALCPECLCGRVLLGETSTEVDCFSKNGSFCSSDLKSLNSTLLKKPCGFTIRGECLKQGFNSLCLIPVRVDGQTQGLLLIADKRKGMFPKDTLEFLEKSASFFGVCFERKLMQESLFGYSKDVEAFIRRRTKEISERNIQLQNDLNSARESEQKLTAANAKMESAKKSRALFLARLSHDLRAPLTAIMGFSELLIECGLEGENADFAKLIIDRCQDLSKLIQEIHDLAKLESGGLHLNAEIIDLRLLAANIVKGFERQAKAKGLLLEYDLSERIPEELFADPLRISQVISNLLSNSVKFTDKGHIKLIAQPAPAAIAGFSSVKFCISDTGSGMQVTELSRIFEDYTQVHPSKRKRSEGSGLGLAICRKLVSLMGGRIWAESSPGAGSNFHFTLNLEIPRRQTPPQ